MIVHFAREAHESLGELCDDATRRGTETHAYLLGHRSLAELVVTEVVRAGSPVEEAFMTRPDYAASAQAIRPLLASGLVLLGEAHRHPGIIGPSGGDQQMLRSIQDTFPGYLCVVVATFADRPAVTTAHSVENGAIVEHPVRVIDGAYPALLPASTRGERLLHLGAGSGASLCLLQAAKLPLEQITIADFDVFEERNLPRHLATPRANGKPKASWLARFLQARSTATIRSVDLEITAQREAELDALVATHSLVVNGTGHPLASIRISRACTRVGKPCLHAGAFALGSGGFVFLQVPGGACYECLYGLRLDQVADDRVTMETLTKQYGYTEAELSAQLGLWTDVNTVASIQAKVLVEFLKYGTLQHNLFLIDNHKITIAQRQVQQDPACVACNGGTS